MKRSFRQKNQGMTLVEVAVAAVILSLLAITLAHVLQNVSLTVRHGRSTADLHLRIRMAFARIGKDLAHCVKRNQLDWQMIKRKGNDRLFFFSRVPGYFVPSGKHSVSPTKRGCISLIGYGVGTQHHLVRLDKGLAWKGTPDAVAYLPATITARWPDLTGAFTQSSAEDSFHHVLSPSTFRMECALLLKDGSVRTTQNPLTANAFSAKNVAAVVITVAALEPAFSARVKDWKSLIEALPDAPPGRPALKQWSAALNNADYLIKHKIAPSVASHVWIYQRYFPIP